jgi:hypothetical protein
MKEKRMSEQNQSTQQTTDQPPEPEVIQGGEGDQKGPQKGSPPEVEVQETLVEEGHFPEPGTPPDGDSDSDDNAPAPDDGKQESEADKPSEAK